MPFGLESCHAGGRLDGCLVALDSMGTLAIAAARPGRFVAVLRAGAPLRVAEQGGVRSARPRPGWDGTLGYSLCALATE